VELINEFASTQVGTPLQVQLL